MGLKVVVLDVVVKKVVGIRIVVEGARDVVFSEIDFVVVLGATVVVGARDFVEGERVIVDRTTAVDGSFVVLGRVVVLGDVGGACDVIDGRGVGGRVVVGATTPPMGVVL